MARGGVTPRAKPGATAECWNDLCKAHCKDWRCQILRRPPVGTQAAACSAKLAGNESWAGVAIPMNDMSPHRPVSATVRAASDSAVGISKKIWGFSRQRTASTSIFTRPRSTRCSARTAPANRLWSRSMYGLIQPTAGDCAGWERRSALPGPPRRARSASAWCSSISRCSTISPWPKMSRSASTAGMLRRHFGAARAKCRHDYGLPLDPKREVWQLSVGERQRIEIVRALMQNPEAADPRRADRGADPAGGRPAFHRAGAPAAEGRGILYISHKLEEVKRLCDTATILRGGKKSRPAIRARRPRHRWRA